MSDNSFQTFYEELKLLLIQQVNDELHDFKTNSGTSRGTGKP